MIGTASAQSTALPKALAFALAFATFASCQDPQITAQLKGQVFLVSGANSCPNGNAQNPAPPSAVHPVHVKAVNQETGNPFPEDLIRENNSFNITVLKKGQTFALHFYYSTKEEYVVLYPPLEVGANKHQKPLKVTVPAETDIWHVCLMIIDPPATSTPNRKQEQGEHSEAGSGDDAGSFVRDTDDSFALSNFEPPQRAGDAAAEQKGKAVTVSGRIVENADSGSGQQPGKPPNLGGLRVTIYGIAKETGTQEYLNQGISKNSGQYTVPLESDPAKYDSYVITVVGKNYEAAISLTDSVGPQGDISVEKATGRIKETADIKPNLETPARGAQFDGELIQDLPLGIRRSIDSLVLLLPGIAPAAQTIGPDGPRFGRGLGSAGQFSSNGLRSTANDFLVDGTDNNDENGGGRRQGYLIPGSESVEAVGAFGTLNALYDARYGKAPGAQVDSSSLSGGARPHLTTYGLLSDQRFNAENYFDGLITHGSQPLTVGGRPVWIDGSPVTLDPIGPAHLPDTEITAGAVVSGAVPGLPDTFFTSSFEYDRVRTIQRLDFAVPSIADRGYHGTGATGLPIIDQSTNSYPATLAGDAFFSLYPFPNNPVGPYGPNTYTRDRPANADGLRTSLRLDHTFHFAGASFLGLRYSYENSNTLIPETGGALDSGLNVQSQPQSFTGFLSSTPTSKVANTLRVSWGTARYRLLGDRDASLVPSDFMPGDQFLLNTPVLADTTVSGSGPVTFQKPGLNTEGVIGPIGQLNLAGYSSVGADPFNFPQRRADSTFQLADTASFRHGRQTFTAGAEAWLITLNSNVNQNARPTVTFYGEPVITEQSPPTAPFGLLLSPTSLAALGVEGNVYQTFTTMSNTSLQLFRPQLDQFIEDDIHLGRSLELSLGFRFSFNGAPFSARFQNTYSPTGTFVSELNSALQQCPDRQAICNGIYNFLTNAFPPGFGQVYKAAPFGYSPRLGLAWDPVGDGRTVIRLGAGTYAGQLPAEIISESGELFPQSLPLLYASGGPSGPANHFVNLGAANSPVPIMAGTLNLLQPGTNIVNILNSFQNPSSSTPLGSILSEALIVPVEPAAGLRNPNAYEFGVTIDQSFWRNVTLSAAYVGTLAEHLAQANLPEARLPQILELDTGNLGSPCANANVPLEGGLCPTFEFVQSGHVNLADPTVYSSTGNSSYHSLQLQLRIGRSWLQASSAFTWAHSIDDASDMFDNAGSFALPQNPNNLAAERASSNFDIRLRSVSYFVADSASRHVLLRGWRLSGILTLQSGPPFTVNTVYNVALNGLNTDTLATVQGLVGPGVGVSVPGLSRQTRLTFASPNLQDPAAQADQFLCQPYPCYGAVGRNTFRAAGLEDLDLALSRDFAIKPLQGHRVQLRAEGYNALNRTNFAIPVRILEAPGFGNSASTVTGNRRLQLVLKYSF